MKKLIHIFYYTMITLTLSIFIYSMQLTSYASEDSILYLSSSPGETETEVGINYHASGKGSYVLYTSNSTFANATKSIPTETLFSKSAINNETATVWKERYVCKVSLKDLSPNTKYYYKVVLNSTESAINTFTTTSKTGTDNKFIFATDIHASTSASAVSTTNTLITNILNKNKDVKMVYMTGDQVDRGGYETTWQTYYNNLPVMNNLLQATIPGNHEYYHSSDSGYISPEFYNQFFNNPQNGPEDRLNSTYYFEYGNILFIQIDIINKKFLTEQQEWFKNVVANHPSQWIIVGSHAGAISTGPYESDSSYMKNNWTKIFEECQVDICFSGHEHIYIRRDRFFENELNPTLGVSYLVGPAAGAKNYTADPSKTDSDLYFKDFNINYHANLIHVTDTTLTCDLYNKSGVVEDTYQLKAKRPSTIENISKEEILDKIVLAPTESDTKMQIRWDKSLWGNVKKIEIIKKQETSDFSQTVIMSAPSLNYSFVRPIYAYRDYKIEIVVTCQDDSILKKTINIYDPGIHEDLSLSNHEQIVLKKEDATIDYIKDIKVQLNNTTYPMNEDSLTIHGLQENTIYEGVISYKYTKDGLNETRQYPIQTHTLPFAFPEEPFTITNISKNSMDVVTNDDTIQYTNISLYLNDVKYVIDTTKLSSHIEGLVEDTSYEYYFEYTILDKASSLEFSTTTAKKSIQTLSYELPSIDEFTLKTSDDTTATFKYDYNDTDNKVTEAYILYGNNQKLTLNKKRGTETITGLDFTKSNCSFKLVLVFDNKTIESETVTIDKIEVTPTPDPVPEKKGCKKNTIYETTLLLSSLSICLYLLKKKHN